jgi:adenylate cyclase
MVDYLNKFFGICAKNILEQGGTLDKFVGDMMLSFFNAPESLENHPLHCVQAAIQLQIALKECSDSWIREHFSIGIGINVGPAVVGNVGSQEQCDYTAIGDSINIAHQLQQAAEPGQILVSRAVFDLTQEKIAYKEIDVAIVKGCSKSVEVYSVDYK